MLRHVLLLVAEMLASLDVQPQVLLVADAAADDGLLAVVLDVEVDLLTELDLLALGARDALTWAVMIDVALQLLRRELHFLAALVGTKDEARLTSLAQMLIDILVVECLLAAKLVVRTLEQKREELGLEQAMDLARLLRVTVTAAFLRTHVATLDRAMLA